MQPYKDEQEPSISGAVNSRRTELLKLVDYIRKISLKYYESYSSITHGGE